ncbi:UDP-N-acetylmuramoyl-L-alanyl-D-glutamate--2,6-diaminopimelate ligase [Actinopolymorpha sp. B17G11]|uniref:UDP-N-acetylmuramoyl-L-alanyl-D-glutamate--2, 6-diaminopimelate ligase n=1 Tax=Actinopolymorpha sp. B17G11 TaxID=3160861 RepID=UPI0032E4C569
MVEETSEETMLLSDLLSDLDWSLVSGNAQQPITDITAHSDDVKDGSLFVCLTGGRVDGHSYIPECGLRGAKAFLVEDIHAAAMAAPGSTVVQVPSTRAAAGRVASRFFRQPTRDMTVIAVTGTDGKSSVTNMVGGALTRLGRPTGTVGTTGVSLDGSPIAHPRSTPTTPEAIDLQRIFAGLRERGATSVVLEASSIALAAERLAGSRVDIGVLTNLTSDHLDAHGSMEGYRQAKLRLFEMCARAIVNGDDNFSNVISRETRGPVLTYGIEGRGHAFMASDIQVDGTGATFVISHGGHNVRAASETPGIFAVYNCLAATAVCVELGYGLAEAVEATSQSSWVPGRFQVLRSTDGLRVIVDYAHTAVGLRSLLKTVRALSKGRVITVFGCGGDRDKTKREPMGIVAGSGSDVCVLTSDNPRSEDPEAIMRQVEGGLKQTACRYVKLSNREDAIQWAIDEALRHDVVVVAGKGDEKYQIVGDEVVEFSDAAAVDRCLARSRGTCDR